MDEPHSTSGAQLLKHLLEHQTFISDTVVEPVISSLKSIYTDSTIVFSSTAISSFSSMDIYHPLISVFPSMDMLHSSHPLIVSIVPSTAISQPLISPSSISVDEEEEIEVDENTIVESVEIYFKFVITDSTTASEMNV